MKIAVIVPSFDDGRVLNSIRSIDALRARSAHQWVIRIQDGGSPQRLLRSITDILQPGDSLCSAKDHGIFDALNIALDSLSDDINYVGWIGTDDVYDTMCDIRSVDAAISSGPDILVGETLYCRYGEVRRRFAYSRLWRLVSRRGAQYPHFSTIVRRSFLGAERFDIGYSIAADVEFFLRLNVKAPKVMVLPIVLTEMTEGGTSSRDLKRIIVANGQSFRIYKKHFGLFGAVANVALKAMTKSMSRLRAVLGPKRRPRTLEC